MIQPPPINQSMTSREWGLILLLSVLWGGSFYFVAVALRGFPPVTLIVLRIAIAMLLLLCLLRAMGQKLPRDLRLWRDFLIMGAFNNLIPFALLATAQTRIGGGLASIVNSSMPLWTALIAHAFTRDERLTGRRLTGVIVGVSGVAMMIGVDALHTIGADVLPQLACVAAAMCYAIASVFGRRFRASGLTPVVATTGTATAATAMGIPTALFLEQPWTLPAPGADAIWAIVAISVFSTTAGYLIYYRLLASAGAMNASLVTFLVPVSAILCGVLLLGETLALQHIAGMLTIFAGLALIDGRIARLMRARLR